MKLFVIAGITWIFEVSAFDLTIPIYIVQIKQMSFNNTFFLTRLFRGQQLVKTKLSHGIGWPRTW